MPECRTGLGVGLALGTRTACCAQGDSGARGARRTQHALWEEGAGAQGPEQSPVRALMRACGRTPRCATDHVPVRRRLFNLDFHLAVIADVKVPPRRSCACRRAGARTCSPRAARAVTCPRAGATTMCMCTRPCQGHALRASLLACAAGPLCGAGAGRDETGVRRQGGSHGL